MENNEIIIKFGGDGNINVDTLTEFLDIYKKLFYTINAHLGYSPEDLAIEVSPPENGSFKIRISPQYKKAFLQNLAAVVTGTLSGLIVYYVTAENTTITPQQVESTLSQKGIEDKDVQKNVYNIYQKVTIPNLQ